jgi:hypothetical protein
MAFPLSDCRQTKGKERAYRPVGGIRADQDNAKKVGVYEEAKGLGESQEKWECAWR